MPSIPDLGVVWVGLGNMGGPMSARLVEAGYDVLGYDLSEPARRALLDRGGRIGAGLPGLAAAADLVFLMLPNSDVVESVVADLLPSLRAGTTIIDMSSSEPTRTRKLAVDLSARGVGLIDAPVSGGVRAAVDGTLTIMVGGEPDKVPGLLDAFSHLGHVTEVGGVGTGHAVKALNNLLSAAHFWLTSEAVAIGIRLGIDPQVLLSVVNTSSGRSGSSEAKWPRFVLPETFDSGFEAQLMFKDVKIAVGLAEDVDLPSSLGGELSRLWQDALGELPPHADHTEIAKVILERAEKAEGAGAGG